MHMGIKRPNNEPQGTNKIAGKEKEGANGHLQHDEDAQPGPLSTQSIAVQVTPPDIAGPPSWLRADCDAF
jgi:hypothetical protein